MRLERVWESAEIVLEITMSKINAPTAPTAPKLDDDKSEDKAPEAPPVVTPPVKEEEPKVEESVECTHKPGELAKTTRCDWHVVKEGAGIRCINHQHGTTFVGTMAEFNAAIRG